MPGPARPELCPGGKPQPARAGPESAHGSAPHYTGPPARPKSPPGPASSLLIQIDMNQEAMDGGRTSRAPPPAY